MIKERNIKIGNTFSVLQEGDQEPILEEEILPPITKLYKEGIKVVERRERVKLVKYLNEKRKRRKIR